MSWIHDLGGKTGYGAVDVHEAEEPFHADFEGRMWAISRIARAPDWTIDWWRHVRELIPAKDYLNRPYFDSWMQTSTAAFIDSGYFTLDELTNAKGGEGSGETIDAIEQNRQIVTRFDGAVNHAPQYNVGDAVRTIVFEASGHTRLPEYARGKQGAVHAYRGAHIFPDDSAKGEEHHMHLYTVGFDAVELWGEEAISGDIVYLDLWEAYFEG